MDPDESDHVPVPEPTASIPGWLQVTSIALMGVVSLCVLALALGYVTAGPADNLALVALIYAAVLAIPLLAALLFWATGFALRRRAPRSALALTIASTVVTGFLVAMLVAWLLLSI